MSTQTTHGQSFPAPCKRCGGALYQPADVCPYCGASHPLGESPRTHFVPADGPGHHPLGPKPHPESVTPNLASPDTPIPPLSRPQVGAGIGSRWLLTRGLIGLVVVLLGYGGYALLGEHHSATPADDEQDTKMTAGTIAPYAPDTSANPGSANAAANPSAAPTQPIPQASAVPHYRDLPESLHAARARREANDLSGAQAAVNAALSMEPGNADAQTIQHELTPLEQRRDAALQTAQGCSKDHLWTCVAHSASDALAIDSGSAAAKSLLARAIVETGWAPLGSHAAPTARPAPATQAATAAPVAPVAPVAPIAPANPAAGPAAGSVDAQVRAIAESGWRNSSTAGTKPASGAPPAH